MLEAPSIDPIAFSIGPLAIRWYGLMYLVGFFGAWRLAVLRARRTGAWTDDQVGDLMLLYGVLGVFLGGRIGYVVFYKFGDFLANPLMILKVWEGGMSFHGGLLGVLGALLVYAHRHRRNFFDITDFVAPFVPIGLGAGRIGNFINHELWGAPTDLPWGMVFRGAGPWPRHPSQLYEFALEGVVLFALLWWFSSRPRPRYAVSGMFLLAYGAFRFAVEFVREPDAHLGHLAGGWFTMGQALSLPMIAGGVFLLALAYRRAAEGGGR